jgi:hypothetical protein
MLRNGLFINIRGRRKNRKHGRRLRELENACAKVSFEELRRKKQYGKNVMGGKPIIVVKGNTTEEVKKVLDWAKERGKGTEEQRALVRIWLGR